MNATLNFNLPEDQGDFQAAIDGGKWKSVCFDFDQWLRNKLKYADRLPDLEEVREELNNMIKNENLYL